MWDGLAETSGGDWLLLEAKAQIPEMVSTPTRAVGKSRQVIESAMQAGQQALAPRTRVDWTGTFYQYANRVAHLHHFREEQIKAHLIFVYFLNAADVKGPSERAEWEGAIKLVEGYISLGRHRLKKYIHKVFVDVRDLQAFG